MRPIPMVMALGLVAALAQGSASAQSGHSRPQLHAGTADSSCYFELDPELTQAEFAQFAGELGAIMRPPQLGDTATRGKHPTAGVLQRSTTRFVEEEP